ncbi:insulinase family protein [Sorangium cellulosum]|uniref:Peptidase M16 C-terminal domain-containing protein n=1 Tax=Sorangium cellulosum So0157-2 TaxID=1254432 RepID=S4Y5W2_SORCE|nr:insulinase family protein [Sorangium cellulosum]AGP40204.1 hypothetical protein SCE1572_40295 [Sorangium cellulosum So0157-2]
MAGDFDPQKARDTIERYFGGIPGRPVPAATAPPPVKLSGVVRQTIEDDVNLPKVVMAWHSPARFAPGDAELDLLATALEQGKASRLYKALVAPPKPAPEGSGPPHLHGNGCAAAPDAGPGPLGSAAPWLLAAALAAVRWRRPRRSPATRRARAPRGAQGREGAAGSDPRRCPPRAA